MAAILGLQTVTPSEALRRPRRVSRPFLVGATTMVAAVLGVLLFWGTAPETRAVVVATRDLPAGSRLTPTDLSVGEVGVGVGDTVYRAAIPATERAALVGRPLAEPVHAHQILVRAQFSGRPPLGAEQRVATIPVAPERAVGGRLEAGDTVDVFVTTKKGQPDAATELILTGALVYDVGSDDRQAAVTTATSTNPNDPGRVRRGPVAWITLIVTREQTAPLLAAAGRGDVSVVLVPPGQAPGPAPGSATSTTAAGESIAGGSSPSRPGALGPGSGSGGTP